MTLKTPFTPHLSKGAYSAIVFKDGDLYVAEDKEGNIIIENTDASTTIQKAIDDYAAHGLVLVKPTVTLSSALQVLAGGSSIEFLGLLNLATGINGIEIGDTTHSASGVTIKLNTIDGVDKSSHGIVLKNTCASRIYYTQIKRCSIGLYFNPCTSGKANENVIKGARIDDCGTAGIRFSTSSLTMEGNHFETTIFTCPVGFDLLSGGNSAYQTFVGCIDCAGTGGSEDIKDAVGHQLFLCDFARMEVSTIKNDTLLLNVRGSALDGIGIEMKGASADFQNIGFTPLLGWDFNRDSTGDWTKTGCTMGAPSKSVTRLTATGTSSYIERDISVDGGQAQLILFRYKLITGAAQVGRVYYKTSGHGYSASYLKAIPKCRADGQWHLQVLDMSDLDVGGSDWIDNTITGFRFNFRYPAVVTDVMDIDFIAIGTRAYSSMYHMDDALKTPATGGAVGNKGDIRWDANYFYICTAKDTWRRASLYTW